MKWTRVILGLSLAFSIAAATAPAPPVAPDSATTQPSPPKADLLGPLYSNAIAGIQFRPPAQCVQIDKSTADTIVEFDRQDYDWRLTCWRVLLERALPVTIHKDQFGQQQDGVLEITLGNIKRQTAGVQVLRNEVINVGRVRVGMIGVRYQTADHQRHFTQQAIFEAPDADCRLYYFFDLTGPGKPIGEPDDIVNPMEKLAFETFSQLVDSVVLLDRAKIAEDQRQRLYHTEGLFLLWTADHWKMIKSALIPQQYQRIIKDGQDIGYQRIVEELQPNAKAPEMSMVRIGVGSHLITAPGQTWDTQTLMTSTLDGKHEHFETAARCTNDKGELADSFTQLGDSDERTKAVAEPPQMDTHGPLLGPGPEDSQQKDSAAGNMKIVTVRTLEVTATHQKPLTKFKVDVPVFYVPQAFSYLLPSLLPHRPENYMLATYVPSMPSGGSSFSGGNVMGRYLDVLPAKPVRFHGQDFQAIPIEDKITLQGAVTTYYYSAEGKFLGSTSTFPDGDKTSTVDVVPTDEDTLKRLWNREVLNSPAAPPAAPTVP